MAVAQTLFYYPYASFSDDQSALLHAVALYFDKLYVLDPTAAVVGGVGPARVSDDASELEAAGLLERVRPAAVLEANESRLIDAVRRDLTDPHFVSLCRREARAPYWEIALAKVPTELRSDNAMRRVLREAHPAVESEVELYGEDEVGEQLAATARAAQLREAAAHTVYDEYRETRHGMVEYRYARYDVEVGESLMLNHTLLASLNLLAATPITDDPFHRTVLKYKIRRELDRLNDVSLRANLLALRVFTELRLELPALQDGTPLSQVIAFRKDGQALAAARDELSWLAREIGSKPFTPEFDDELYRVLVPRVRQALKAAAVERDAWAKDHWKARWSATGLGLAVAAGALSIVLAPTLVPAAFATGVLALAGTAAAGIPTVQDLLSRPMMSGFQYLVRR